MTTADFTAYRPIIGTVLPGTSPQVAAGGDGPLGSTAPTVAVATVDAVLKQAIHAWAVAGVPAQDLSLLRGASVVLTSLPAGILAETA